MPDIDRIASRLNCDMGEHALWKVDPHPHAVDTFSIEWTDFFYAFPPFSMVGKVLHKIELDAVEGILVVSYWTTQPWFSRLVRLLRPPLFLSAEKAC